MKTEEANYIISEYMGTWMKRDSSGCWLPNPDYLSLDALMPVWEKLDAKGVWEIDLRCGFGLRPYTDLVYVIYEKADTLQEAAAIATAKAIQEVKE